MHSKKKILEFMKEKAYNPMTAEELADRLEIGSTGLAAFLEDLRDLEREGEVIRTRKKRYGIPEKMDLVPGKLQCNPKGFGFVLPRNEMYEDIFIPADGINGAMHNDRVIAKIVKGKTEGSRTEGEIIRILERANKKVVGTFERSRHFGFVVPDDPRILDDVFIARDDTAGAREGDKVVAEIDRWPERRRNPEGRVIEVLGRKGDVGVDVLSIIRSYGIPEVFPESVLREAERLPLEVQTPDLERRVDLRDMNIVTIDERTPRTGRCRVGGTAGKR